MFIIGVITYFVSVSFNNRFKKVNLLKHSFMTTTAIRKKLVDYLKIADEKKLKAIYTMVEDEIATEENDWNEDFYKELQRRSRNFKKGTSKTYTWEETKQEALKRVKSKSK